MDKIIIAELEVACRVGVPEAERATPQRLLLTIEMAHDLSKAGRTDALADTIDYFAVSQRVAASVADGEWQLIETLAADIAQLVLEEFGVAAVAVEVKKFIIPEARHVAVRIERGRPTA